MTKLLTRANRGRWLAILGATISITAVSSPMLARTVFLNGIDVSSARNQTLKNVNLRIDENGNVFIEAPHYQVNEQSEYTPLSQWSAEVRRPMHKGKTSANPQPAAEAAGSDANAPATLIKAGSKDAAGTAVNPEPVLDSTLDAPASHAIPENK